ncbi:MAG: hypothetical protein V3U92_13380 [Cellulophaga sp.]
MKKLSLLILIAFLSFSCSSSDDNDTDLIIAKWQVGKTIIFPVAESSYTIDPDECHLLSTYTFRNDKTIKVINYEPDNEGKCELDSVNFEYYNWTKIKDGEYRITSKKMNEPEEIDVKNVTFHGNEMIWTVEIEVQGILRTLKKQYFTLQN